jgi:hypothetical protein
MTWTASTSAPRAVGRRRNTNEHIGRRFGAAPSRVLTLPLPSTPRRSRCSASPAGDRSLVPSSAASVELRRRPVVALGGPRLPHRAGGLPAAGLCCLRAHRWGPVRQRPPATGQRPTAGARGRCTEQRWRRASTVRSSPLGVLFVLVLSARRRAAVSRRRRRGRAPGHRGDGAGAANTLPPVTEVPETVAPRPPRTNLPRPAVSWAATRPRSRSCQRRGARRPAPDAVDDLFNVALSDHRTECPAIRAGRALTARPRPRSSSASASAPRR